MMDEPICLCKMKSQSCLYNNVCLTQKKYNILNYIPKLLIHDIPWGTYDSLQDDK